MKVFFTPEDRADIEACVRDAAVTEGIELHEVGVQPEHVHCVAELPLSMAPEAAVDALKARSAALYFERNPLRGFDFRTGDLWSAGKFASSVGLYDVERVKRYVRNQEEHHKVAA